LRLQDPIRRHKGATPQPGTPDQLASQIKGDLARWTKLIKDNNIQVE
jgi:hypothetical protein